MICVLPDDARIVSGPFPPPQIVNLRGDFYHAKMRLEELSKLLMTRPAGLY